jgi:cysteinyl-tRNA synthetase
MDDDLNTPHVLGLVFDAVSAGDSGRVARYLETLGFGLQAASAPESGPDRRAEAERLLEMRRQARHDRDFALADSLRAQIDGMGFIVEDTPQGQRLVPKES